MSRPKDANLDPMPISCLRDNFMALSYCRVAAAIVEQLLMRRSSKCRDRRRRSPDVHASRNKPPPAPMPEKPEVYGVYRGRVSNVLEFGCFVELQGFRKKAEGLVHTSNISKQK